MNQAPKWEGADNTWLGKLRSAGALLRMHSQGHRFTRWLWTYWQHNETGRICLTPRWKNPGPRYHRIHLKP